MRIMTALAFPIFSRLVSGLGGFRESIMAFKTKSRTLVFKHFGQRRAVRIVTGGALAVFSRLMSDLVLGQEVIVACETDLLLGCLHAHRKLRDVAFRAFLFFVGWVSGKNVLHRHSDICVAGRPAHQRTAVLVINNRWSIRWRPRPGDTIEK